MTILDGEIIPPGRRVGIKCAAADTANNQRAASHPVGKIPKQNSVNRNSISAMQHQILGILFSAGQPRGEKIGHLPRTGEIVDALGLPRSRAAFASVSRSLSRLEKAGRVVSYSPSINTRGRGRHYALTAHGGAS